jgi:hypothetical protein
MSNPHPFPACVGDNEKRFGPEGAKRVCAVLKDIGEGTTRWRKAATKPVIDDMVDTLLAAADGDHRALMDMWQDYMTANGDKSPAKADEQSVQDLMIQLLSGDHEV